MFEQLFDVLRKASESSMSAQREVLKQWAQQWPANSLSTAQTAIERNAAFQKRWLESTTETMAKQRELVDSAWQAGMQVIEHASRLSDAKTSDDYRHQVEELSHKVFELFRTQSEAQYQHLMKASQAWVEVTQVR